MRTISLGLATCLALGVSVAACSGTTIISGAGPGDGGVLDTPPSDASATPYLDVSFVAARMDDYLNERFEIRLVDKDNAVQMKAVYAGVTTPRFSLYLSKTVPQANAPYRLDFWVDHNKSLTYDGIIGGISDHDHAWRRVLVEPLPEDVRRTGNVYNVDFIHDTFFVDIFTDLQQNKISGADTLLPVNLQIVGAGAYVGKMVEIRVVDKVSGRLVALHRQGQAQATYTAGVSGVINDGSVYEVSVFADLNDDERVSADEPSWKVDLTSSGTGLAGDLNLATLAQSPIETRPY